MASNKSNIFSTKPEVIVTEVNGGIQIDGGKVVATYKDGVIVNVIAVPAQSGGVTPITVDTTVDAPTGTASLSGLSSYFN